MRNEPSGHGCNQPSTASLIADHVPDSPLHAAAFDQLHGEVLSAFVLTDVVNRHDVRMVQPGDSFGFGSETLDVGGGRQLSLDVSL